MENIMKFSPVWAALSATLLLSAPSQAQSTKVFMADHVKSGGVVGLKATDDKSQISTYIVELYDQPVATYAGEVSGLKATNKTLQANVASTKKNKSIEKQPHVARYLSHLAKTQDTALAGIAKVISKNVQPELRYNWAMNGFSMRMTATEAEKAANAPGVKRIYKERVFQLSTDTGPTHIGADKIWQGIATGVEAKGEGIVVGIIDSGVNTDSDSFKATGDDGYIHTNPFTGYLGDCVADATLCTDKLVGVISFPEITDEYYGIAPENGEDMNGHGSHTASTTAGNVLRNVPILKAGESNVSDGVQIGSAEFSEISGVAPHANIISYQTCGPTGGCGDALTVKAVDMAIAHGVDVINFSIGPGGDGGNPWTSASGVAFLKAREAGIFVAVAAGNAGNGAGTVGNVAPWTTVVANYTHDRIFEKNATGTDDNANTLPMFSGIGGLAAAVDAPVIYAGDLVDIYEPDRDFSLCKFEMWDFFPELENKIVVCDRGDFALMEKAQYVQQMGGVGIVIRNTPTSGTSLYNVPYGIPGVLINQEAGDALLSWMNESTNPTLSLSEGHVSHDDLMANSANGSSSRGPSLYAPENMVPHIAAPGTDIYAAYSDDRAFDYEGGADFAFLSGTSMASPHIAGAAALLTQLNPGWTPAEMQSAMMMSANRETTKEDLATPSDIFDHGAGMVNVAAAAKVGLLLDEGIENYAYADPELGGDPKALNVPYMVDSNCWGECSFTRTFKAVRDGKWTLAIDVKDSEMNFVITPAVIEASAGEEVQVTVDVTFGDDVKDAWTFAQLTMTEAADSSVLALPIGIQPMVAQIETWNQIALTRNAGDVTLDGYRFRRPDKVTVETREFYRAQSFYGELAQDSDNRTPLDDTKDGVEVFSFDVTAETKEIGVVIGKTNGYDMDLFLGWDSNADGVPEEVEFTCASTAEQTAQYEACSIAFPSPGKYWVMVHNWESQSPGSVDSFRVDILQYLDSDKREVSVSAPTDATDAYGEFPLTMAWEGELENGVYYSAIDFAESGDDGASLALGRSNLIIDRSEDAFNISVDESIVAPGDEVTFMIDLAAIASSEEVVSLELMLSNKFSFVSSSVDAAVSGNTLSWDITKAAEVSVIEVVAQVNDNETGTMSTSWNYKFASAPDVEFTGQVSVVNPNSRPVASSSASVTSAKVDEAVTLSAKASVDADGDTLTYRWEQTGGEHVSLSDISTVSPMFTAPSLREAGTLTFKVLVSDGQLTSESEVTVNVEKDKDGGSFGWLMLCVLGLFGASRKSVKK